MKKCKSYQILRKAFMENTPCIQNPPPTPGRRRNENASWVSLFTVSHFSMSWYLLQRSEQSFKVEAFPTLSFIEIVVDFYMQTHLNSYLNLNSYAGKMCGI